MEQENRRKVYIYLPWVLLFAVLIAVTGLGLVYKVDSNPFATRFNKIDLLSTMRIHLLEAIEAEKNAVLATTDEASEAYAAQARQAADKVELSRKEIESIMHKEKNPRETELITEFSACWSRFRELDDTILDLATKNSNLKARRLSSTQVAREVQRFEDSLNRITMRNTQGRQSNEAVALAYAALTASLKIFALQKTHIEELDDHEMDKIEEDIRSYDGAARQALGALRNSVGPGDNDDLKTADGAYEQFMSLTAEVLQLSRMNTNLKSAELSLGKKRLISSQCQDSLATLQETVQAEQFKPTR